MQRHHKGRGGDRLAEALKNGALEPKTLTAELFAGRAQAIHEQADALGLDARATRGRADPTQRADNRPQPEHVLDQDERLRTGN